MMRAMREKKDMSQQAVALEIGVERSTVAKWESGKSRPRAELLPKLANRVWGQNGIANTTLCLQWYFQSHIVVSILSRQAFTSCYDTF